MTTLIVITGFAILKTWSETCYLRGRRDQMTEDFEWFNKEFLPRIKKKLNEKHENIKGLMTGVDQLMSVIRDFTKKKPKKDKK